MKNKKIILPMTIVIVAIAGAFANNLSRQDNIAIVDRMGYLNENAMCIPTAITCSTIFAPYLCTYGSNILYDTDGITCPFILYRKM